MILHRYIYYGTVSSVVYILFSKLLPLQQNHPLSRAINTSNRTNLYQTIKEVVLEIEKLEARWIYKGNGAVIHVSFLSKQLQKPEKSSEITQILTFCQLLKISITIECANAIEIFLEEKFEYIQICRMKSVLLS